MIRYSFGEYLFETVEVSIEKKYNISNPTYLYNFKEFSSRKNLTEWFNKIYKQGRWVKYKFLGDNKFELKDFYPDPSDEICYKIINNYIKNITNTPGKHYIKTSLGLYNMKEIKSEFLFNLRDGFSAIYPESITIKDISGKNRNISEIWYSKREFDIDIQSGFMVLENKY